MDLQGKLGNYVLKKTDPGDRISDDPSTATWKRADPHGQPTLDCYAWERTFYFVMPQRFWGFSIVIVVSITLSRSSQISSIIKVKKNTTKMTAKEESVIVVMKNIYI